MFSLQMLPGPMRFEASEDRGKGAVLIPMHRFSDPGGDAESVGLYPVKQVQWNPPLVLLQYEY